MPQTSLTGNLVLSTGSNWWSSGRYLWPTQCPRLGSYRGVLCARLHQCLTRGGNGSNASVCLHLFCPDAGDIDRSINVNVLAVACCFPCLLIKIMQNERKAIFFLGKKWNTINSDWMQPAGMWWGCLPPTRLEDTHSNWGKIWNASFWHFVYTMFGYFVSKQCFEGRFA